MWHKVTGEAVYRSGRDGTAARLAQEVERLSDRKTSRDETQARIARARRVERTPKGSRHVR